jgi:hypothetical protein
MFLLHDKCSVDGETQILAVALTVAFISDSTKSGREL